MVMLQHQRGCSKEVISVECYLYRYKCEPLIK
jgi:hypothetical protein